MLKSTIIAMTCVTFALTATGCASFSSNSGSSSQCAKLKRELVHVSSQGHYTRGNWVDNTPQREQIKRQLAEANCQ